MVAFNLRLLQLARFLHLKLFGSALRDWVMEDRVIKGVDLTPLPSLWRRDSHIRELLSSETTTGLVVAPEGERAPVALQSTAVANEALIGGILKQMHEARPLQLPSLMMLEDVLQATWKKHFQAVSKHKAGAGRSPNLSGNFELSDHAISMCHSDGRYLKSLLSMVRKQVLSRRVAHDPRQINRTLAFFKYKPLSIPGRRLPSRGFPPWTAGQGFKHLLSIRKV